MSENKSNQVLMEVAIAAPVEVVWNAIRERTQLANWFGWDSDGLADEIDDIFHSNATADEARRTIQFEAWEGVWDSFELTDHQGTTLLQVVRFGAPPLDWAGTYDEIVEGWLTFVQQLRLLLERHPGKSRRTIRLSGTSAPGVQKLSAALGLTSLLTEPDGAPFSIRLPTGDAISGTIWHRSQFQLGLEVSEWGNGMLVVTDRGDSEPAGGSVLISTFGLDETSFAEIEARWSAWWTRHSAEAG